MGKRRAFVCVIGALMIGGMSARAGTLTNDVVFTDYTPLSSNVELARRLLTPFEAAELPKRLAELGKGLAEQPIDLTQEKFVVYLPSTKPVKGYGLLVFVPPWDTEKVPVGWTDVLDQTGIIFVSAANSGNDANPIGRREPLALLAYANIVKRYPIDPERVYVGGFSGGSRVAMHLALSYPDVFRGALLNSGSDPIGSKFAPVSPKDLFLRFQESSTLAFVTGEDDKLILESDRINRHTMHDWCVFNVESRDMRGTGHDAADPDSLSWALDTLDKKEKPDAGALADCRAGIDAAVTAKLQGVESLIAAGRRDDAKAALDEINQYYGGLAAPRSVELETRLEK
jgi:pimeloyl-ACP methyl ester carboxylesterase